VAILILETYGNDKIDNLCFGKQFITNMGFLSETETAVQGLEYIINTTRNREILIESVWNLENLYMSLTDHEGARANNLRTHIAQILGESSSFDIDDRLADSVNNTFCGIVGTFALGLMTVGMWVLYNSAPIVL
jgi:hypothetical protein